MPCLHVYPALLLKSREVDCISICLEAHTTFPAGGSATEGFPPGPGHKVHVREPFHGAQPKGEGNGSWSSACPFLACGFTARGWIEGFFGFGFCQGKDLQVSNNCSAYTCGSLQVCIYLHVTTDSVSLAVLQKRPVEFFPHNFSYNFLFTGSCSYQ